MVNFPFPTRKPGYKILCLGAHCDDIEIGCGGTLSRLMQDHPIDFVKWVVFASTETRKQEAITSANIFLEQAKEKDIVVFDYRDDRHQDHRLLSDFTWNTFRQHFILEYEIPKFDGDLGIPNFFIQLSEEQVNKKIRIILDSFKSQAEKHWFDKETFQSLMRVRGMESASLTKYAEAFYARKVML